MKTIYFIKSSYSYLRKRKLRTFLAILGIIIGISSVVTIVILGTILDTIVLSEFEKIGINRVYVTTDNTKDLKETDYLTLSDEIIIKKRFEDSILALSRVYVQNSTISTTDKISTNIMIYGVNESYKKIQQIHLKYGRFLIDNDLLLSRNVIVIDNNLAKKVFNRENVVGETLNINVNNNTVRFAIVGVYKKEGEFLSQLVDVNNYHIAYSPNTALEYLNNVGTRVYGIDMILVDNTNIDIFINNLTYFLESVHNNREKDIYIIQSAEKSLSVAQNIGNIVTLIIGIIAAISLLVGGIGIMNIMLVTVSERTKEIGIRKAIGAKNNDILIQFLIEASIITGIGGIVGILLGLLSGFLVSYSLKVVIPFPIISTINVFLFSVLIGIVFGVFPALKASKLDPVEAFRR